MQCGSNLCGEDGSCTVEALTNYRGCWQVKHRVSVPDGPRHGLDFMGVNGNRLRPRMGNFEPLGVEMSIKEVVQEVEAKVEGFLEKLNPFAHKAEAEVVAEATTVEGEAQAAVAPVVTKVETEVQAAVTPVVAAAEAKVEDAAGAVAEKAVASVLPAA